IEDVPAAPDHGAHPVCGGGVTDDQAAVGGGIARAALEHTVREVAESLHAGADRPHERLDTVGPAALADDGIAVAGDSEREAVGGATGEVAEPDEPGSL